MLITTPFWPPYVTKEMLGNAGNLKLIPTAGVGSDGEIQSGSYG